MAETLPTLPDVTFVDADAQTVINTIIDGYQTASGRTLADGDPVRLWLLSMAYIITMQRAQIDAAAKSNLLYYSQGAALEHLGVLRRVLRTPAQAAKVQLRFALSAPRPVPVLIPAGTRVTADNVIYFATVAALEITAGQSLGLVRAEALTMGAAGNLFAAGALRSIVDPVAYVASVENTEPPQGGRDAETDAELRERIYRAPASFSTAGPIGAYEFWVLSANAALIDVAVVSPTPAVVHVYPLLVGGQIPGQALLDEVQAALSDQLLRPVADRVLVFAPDVVTYELNVTWFVNRARIADADYIRAKVDAAVIDWVQWQASKLGRDINPDALTERLRAAGAKRAVIASPEFTPLQAHQVAVCDVVSVTYGGAENE